MPERHVVLRTLFYSFIAAGAAFLLYGTVQVVYASMPQEGTPETSIYLRIVRNRWEWDPDYVEVRRGARVRVLIENEDSFDHGFAIREFGVDRRVPADSKVTVDFVADSTGTFEFFCSVYCGAGHFDQKGTLVVLGRDEQPAARDRAELDLPVRGKADAVARLDPEPDDGVKVFALTASEFMWNYGGGEVVRSWGYNGQLPGPQIRVTEGDRVRIVVTNELPVATTVHWHGLDVPNEMDGVPGYTQEPIQPGETFIYEFDAYPAGTRFYHTHGSHHGDEAEQMDMGLSGAFIIEPRDFDAPEVDVVAVLTERIRSGLFPINGAIYPHIDPIMVREGDRVRIRMINAGSSTFHPMHLHGHQFTIVAEDGNPIHESAQRRVRNTLPVLPGETYDVEFIADNPGVWLFHCHELQHAAGGMITTVQYEDVQTAAIH
jgi:manganese oxidase